MYIPLSHRIFLCSRGLHPNFYARSEPTITKSRPEEHGEGLKSPHVEDAPQVVLILVGLVGCVIFWDDIDCIVELEAGLLIALERSAIIIGVFDHSD